ncbi:hypothetical protein [Paenibacillus macerans]|uniref:DUF7167 family protein n=1 Tax=Paenibacillus macerans TaxID=44252 RepID=UPI0020416FA2|nr:hypothetical protein [Paenibacillus macerans]MCM3703824.1 hypothetical protein [Paenibacillus macerans]
MAKFRFTVNIGFVGARREEIIEIPDEDLEGATEEERDQLLDEAWREWLWGKNIDGGWEEMEE